jgi:DNA polymerase-1
MRIAILDADVIAYVASAEAANYEPVEWGEGVSTDDSGMPKAKDVAKTMVELWTTYSSCKEAVLAFSGESKLNFRRAVNPGYKSNRTTEKPVLYPALVNWMKDTWVSESATNLEGDDIIGIHVTTVDQGVTWVGVSTDKDLKTLPGHIVHVTREGPKYLTLNDTQANRWWMMQTIMGDPVDGYKGAPGLGIKAAEGILDGTTNLQEMWLAARDAYGRQYNKPVQRKKFLTGSPYQEALMNARCARILRAGDYNYETQEVNLWTP